MTCFSSLASDVFRHLRACLGRLGCQRQRNGRRADSPRMWLRETGGAQDVWRQLREGIQNDVSLAKIRSPCHLIRNRCADDSRTLSGPDAGGRILKRQRFVSDNVEKIERLPIQLGLVAHRMLVRADEYIPAVAEAM